MPSFTAADYLRWEAEQQDKHEQLRRQNLCHGRRQTKSISTPTSSSSATPPATRWRAGHSHLPRMAEIVTCLTSMTLRGPCSQEHELCSFIRFWAPHEGCKRHAIDARISELRIEFNARDHDQGARSHQRTSISPTPLRTNSAILMVGRNWSTSQSSSASLGPWNRPASPPDSA